MEGLHLSPASYFLLAALAVLLLGLVVDKLARKRRGSSSPIKEKTPGPEPWPIIGSLHLMGGYEVPYQAFDALAKVYGPVFNIKLGQVQCMVVSSLEHFREILLQKGDHFDSRPNFIRYNMLFDGNKDNSLAFCDWSEKHKVRRDIIKDHTFPRAFTERFYQLDSIINDELVDLISHLGKGETKIKPFLLQSVGNMFFTYFCSVKFSAEDTDYITTLRAFDEVFYEVNQGYAADFLPWLIPLHRNNLKAMKAYGGYIRSFMVDRIVKKRMENYMKGKEPIDFLDVLLDQVYEDNAMLNYENALFALEDLIGGYSAVANLIIKVLGFVAKNPQVQKGIQQEVDSIAPNRAIALADRSQMPYTEATFLECVRHICSPVVPHVASKDTTIGGYPVAKDTLIFLNNYTLNMSPTLWNEPSKFSPERFVNSEGRLQKPEHYLPFGGGRRSCMGYKMTQYITFITLSTLLQRFHISPIHEYKVPLGDLALPYETMQFRFTPR